MQRKRTRASLTRTRKKRPRNTQTDSLQTATVLQYHQHISLHRQPIPIPINTSAVTTALYRRNDQHQRSSNNSRYPDRRPQRPNCNACRQRPMPHPKRCLPTMPTPNSTAYNRQLRRRHRHHATSLPTLLIQPQFIMQYH